MEISSPIIQFLTQSLSPGGAGTIVVPDSVQPVIRLQYPMQGGTYAVDPDLRGKLASMGAWNSFNQSGVHAADDKLVATFDKGSYELDVFATMKADFTETPANAPGYSVYLADPGGTGAVDLLVFSPVADSKLESQYFRNTMTFNQAGWQLRMATAATVALQNVMFYARSYIRQLL